MIAVTNVQYVNAFNYFFKYSGDAMPSLFGNFSVNDRLDMIDLKPWYTSQTTAGWSEQLPNEVC